MQINSEDINEIPDLITKLILLFSSLLLIWQSPDARCASLPDAALGEITLVQGCQIWPQIGPDWRQVGKKSGTF